MCSIGTLRTDSSPQQVNRWLQAVMRSVAGNWYRRRCLPTVPLEEAAQVADEAPYDTELLDDLLSHLRTDERALLQERFEGYSSAEIGKRRGLTANAIDQRIFRIMDKLKQIAIKEYGIDDRR